MLFDHPPAPVNKTVVDGEFAYKIVPKSVEPIYLPESISISFSVLTDAGTIDVSNESCLLERLSPTTTFLVTVFDVAVLNQRSPYSAK
jgi:hypothetical protein